MQSSPPRAMLAPLRRLAVALCLLAPAPLLGQAGPIAGVVVDRATGAPIDNAQVIVVGTTLRALTDASGRFRFSDVPGTAVVLQVRRIQFRATEDTVNVGDADVRIALDEKALELEGVVVTGTPGATAQRVLGNAVSRIDAAGISEKAPISSMQQLLNGRAAGVVVMPASGMVGSGSRLRVRGASSLSLSNQPLIYLDGVRVNAASATGPANQSFGSSSISRINDINPEDIESIEILKGPAAATLYGTEASNGVIQIITKRGAAGPARWDLMVRQGVNFFANPEERLWLNYARDPASGEVISLDLVEREQAASRPIWRDGHLQEYDLSVSGRTDVFRYYLSGRYENSDGADASNDTRKYHTRANLTVAATPKVSVGVNLAYVTGTTNLACEAGCGGRVWGTVLANPLNLTGANASRRGFHSGTPEQYDLLENYSQQVDRFTGSVQFNHQPASWLSHRLTFGTDRTREQNITFTPRVDSLVNHPVWGSAPLGFKSVGDRAYYVTTVDYAATANVQLSPDLRSSTSVGGQSYRTRDDTVYAQGSVFAAPGLTAISATTTNRLNAQGFVEEKSLGLYVQEQLGWRDRVFLTAGVRTDDHSAFGADFNRAYYPKVGVSWVLSEESFWNVPWVEQLRLRGAYGASGLQPQSFAAIRTYEPVTGPSDSAAVTPQFVGNPQLGPERGTEIELGLDAALFQGRLGLELTYYSKRVKDAILEQQIAPSTGYPALQFFNAGRISNRGLELLARGRPYERDPVAVDLTLNLSTNSSKILDLNPANPDPNEFVTPSQYIRHQVGYPVGSWFEQRVVSAQFDPAGQAINVMCDNGQGGSMPCAGADGVYGANPATFLNDDAPDVYLGRTTPKFEGGVSTTVTLWERLRLYGLLDFKTGFRKLDGNTRVRCPIFARCRENFFPTEFDPERIAGIQSSSNLVDYLIDDATFAKLREISVSYTLPDRWARSVAASRATVSLAGRNVYTWTKFRGLEPEAFFLGGTRGGHSLWEQTTLPQLSTWVLTVNLGF